MYCARIYLLRVRLRLQKIRQLQRDKPLVVGWIRQFDDLWVLVQVDQECVNQVIFLLSLQRQLTVLGVEL